MNPLKLSKRMFSTKNVVIVGAKRTMVGCFMGGLQNFTSPQLGTFATKAALESCNLDPKEVEEVYYGQVI